MGHYLALLVVFVKVSLSNELQYRANLGLQVVRLGISLGVSLGGLAVLFSHTATLGGWRPAELLILTGVYYLMAGLMGTFFGPGLSRLMQDVRNGTLDFVLTKPASSQFMVSFREVEPWRATEVVVGAALLVGGALRLGSLVGVGQSGLFLGALAAGAVIVYSFRLLLATLTFWMVRTDNLMVIFHSLYEAGRYPVGLYPEWLRAVLTFVVPVAFATTVPAEALSGRLTLAGLAGAGGVALVLFLGSAAFWRFGLRHYTGASA